MINSVISEKSRKTFYLCFVHCPRFHIIFLLKSFYVKISFDTDYVVLSYSINLVSIVSCYVICLMLIQQSLRLEGISCCKSQFPLHIRWVKVSYVWDLWLKCRAGYISKLAQGQAVILRGFQEYMCCRLDITNWIKSILPGITANIVYFKMSLVIADYEQWNGYIDNITVEFLVTYGIILLHDVDI